MLNKEMEIDRGVLELERILQVFVFVPHCIQSCHVLSAGYVCAGRSFQDILACLLASRLRLAWEAASFGWLQIVTQGAYLQCTVERF